MDGSQCHLRLWYETHARQLASEPSDNLQVIFDTGHEVGELAYRRYPGGRLIGYNHLETDKALEETQSLLANEDIPALYEPAFIYQGVFVRVDILERLPAGGWRLIEVKSTTGLKDHLVLDAAVQLWVLRGAGIDVRQACVLTLNREYLYQGGEYDLDSLFKLHPVTGSASKLLDTIGGQVIDMQSMLDDPEAPDIAPGNHCFSPYTCLYYAHCTRDYVIPDHGIDELPYLQVKQRSRFETLGIEEIRDIPEDFNLNDLQNVVRQSVLENKALVHGNIQRPLSRMKSPVHHLDFETFAPALPRFIGTRPYGVIPFQFSIHVEREGATLEHIEYLHEDSDDPRPELAARLIEALGDQGTVCTYSGYEKQVLQGLATALPQYEEALNSIQFRLFDLLPVIKRNYYHPDFRGSFSLKSVLPAMVPGAGYDDLAIADGRSAAAQYVMALGSTDPSKRRRIFTELRAYCEQDTMAMVELHKAMAALEVDAS